VAAALLERSRGLTAHGPTRALRGAVCGRAVHCGADVACARVAAEMYVKAHPHEAAASQPLFSRAVQPAQRSSPLSERRKRKAPAALGREQGPQVRRTQKHARVCVLSELPAHVRVAKAPAGPYHTLHRCVDVRTREVFFYPEYTGPAGEEELHAVQWPTVIELPSAPARSGVDAMSSDGCATTDVTEASCSDSHVELTPEPDTRCHGNPEEEAGVAAAPPPTLMERRRRKALSPLRLDIIPPFRRRNTNQICVLEAPATHIRLHAVQAGPHHMMHQCIDAHTEEVFFLPEYVGPSGQHSLHRVFWPQTISTAPKAPEHEQDVPFDESQDCAGSDADEVAGAVEIKGEAGSLALLSAASAYSPCSTSSTSTCFTSSADSFCGASTRKIVMCPAPCAAPVTNFSKQEFVGGGAGKGGVVDAGNGSVLDIMRGGSPGTPCDVAVATASLAARAVTVN